LVLEVVEEIVEELLMSKGEGVILGCKERLKVWENVEEAMRLQHFWNTEDS